tara:strand:+ start:8533 stop:9372 length:840 start_codon:yes stop_codon:yes gene_type:complete
MNIIGLGKAGCRIAELFKQYSQYTVFKFDTDEKLKTKKNCFYIPKQSSAELYDANPIDFKKFKSNLDEDEEVYFILCGSGKVSACSLWLMRTIVDRKINIIYIKPDVSSMDQKSILRNRAHFNILQQYTRSGVFERIFLIDNNLMSDIIGKTSIVNFFSKINNFIVSSVHWLNIYKNSEPIFDTFRDEYISSKICSFSYPDMVTEKMLETFSLNKCNQVKYFFGVNRIEIEEDENLLDKLNRIVTTDSDGKSVSYGVYPTDLKSGFSFAVSSSSEVQVE